MNGTHPTAFSSNTSGWPNSGISSSAIAGPSTLQRKRSASPVKLSNGGGSSSSGNVGAGINGEDGGGSGRPTKMMRPTASEGIWNTRTEEEAARRQNAGRGYTGSGNKSDVSSRMSDLFGRTYLRDKVGRLTREQGVTLDEETIAYLSQAAEQRLKALMTSSIRAQIHRTQTSHHRPPPFTTTSSTSNPIRGSVAAAAEEDGDGRPMWSHVVTSDVNAVMDALTRQSKEVELGFRASRMDRIAREAEMTRIREMREARARENGIVIPPPEMPVASGSGSGDGMEVDVHSPTGSSNTNGAPNGIPSTPRDKPSSATSTPVTTSTPAVNPTPTFGAVKERPAYKKGKKGKGEVSAETAHKMSNMTAMRATGGKMGKYSWLNNAPNVSSPLAGRKKKSVVSISAAGELSGNGEADADGEVDAEGEEDGSATPGSGGGTKRERSLDVGEGELGGTGSQGLGGGPRKKSKLSQSSSVPTDPTSNIPSKSTTSGGKKKKSRPKISIPARRLIPVITPPTPSTTTSPFGPGPTPSTDFPAVGLIGGNASSGPGPKVEERKMVPDDQALTAVDVLFALEREGTGRGMGTAEEVVWKYQGRAGGIWGR